MKFVYKNINFFLLLIALLSIWVYVYFRYKKIEKEGVFVVVRAERFEGAADGSFLYITVFYQGKKINSSIEHRCNKCEGKFFFAKIEKDKPEGRLILYDNEEVPDCIIKQGVPEEGWENIPTCLK